ncbi:MAG TPA: tRNA (N(6)-L-threonylcarbamoyladenosine(37)-C(2))-methylthiotransferase MtaB [Candidatus Hydrogenedentes bacterium]|nr:tRNA (N(6)-L-threonylcarbamoyladenosine(37)-C(2))-methylthiotransferase MtaB [Candidatus Hydrogenedentota bacterium]
MRASIHTLGCRLNQAESSLLAEYLADAGYELVPFGEPADLGIIHTCTVTREADAKSRKLIRQFIRSNPDAFTAVIGCYSQLAAETIARIPGVDLILGNQEKLHLLDYLQPQKNPTPKIVCSKIPREDFSLDVPSTANRPSFLRRRANLKIQDGCNFMCSFCIIPFARGRVRSREISNLLDEARELIRRGAKEIVLTGVNLGTYAYNEKNIYDVAAALGELPGLQRIRISSIEPTTIPEKLFELMNDPAHPLVPFLHIPAQSGSNHILTAMKRNYTREEFLEFIQLAHDSVPGIGIGTDLMVGFPGESEEDFEQSAQLLQESPIFFAHIFKYSERPATPACRIAEKIPPTVAHQRSMKLHHIRTEKTRQFHRAHLGKTLDVLFEESSQGHWTGYTGNYIRIGVSSPENLENQLRPVLLQKDLGEWVSGQLISDGL